MTGKAELNLQWCSQGISEDRSGNQRVEDVIFLELSNNEASCNGKFSVATSIKDVTESISALQSSVSSQIEVHN